MCDWIINVNDKDENEINSPRCTCGEYADTFVPTHNINFPAWKHNVKEKKEPRTGN